MTDLPATIEDLKQRGIDVLRVGYADLTGAERGRDLLVSQLHRTLAGGVAFCKSVFATSPMGDVIPIDGGIGDGLPDVLALPDLDTLRDVPWEPGVAHVIADINDVHGGPCATNPRTVLKRVAAAFHDLGITPIVGPELEFYVLERDGEGWKRYGEGTGNVYVTGRKGDPENLLLRHLRHLDGYGLDVIAANHEFSSGQFEINLWHSEAVGAADRAFRFKTAVKELSRTEDKLATFMAKPFNDEGGSGFHLHFSAVREDGTNVFDDPDGEHGLSKTGLAAIAGILKHAPALAALNNPTVNSYKRFGPDTLAPWLVDWGLDNRSAMVRIPRSAAVPPAWSCGSATRPPTRTWRSPACSPRRCSASGTRCHRRRHWRATDTTARRRRSSPRT